MRRRQSSCPNAENARRRLNESAGLSLRIFTRAILLICLVVDFWSKAAGASNNDPPVREWVVRSWGTAEGLPQNSINAIVQTRSGYLWLGTREGLARFDGLRFSVFGLRTGLESVAVQALLEDREGTLWIGTDGGGLSRFREGRIESVATAQRGVAGDSITSLAEDAQGRLWAGTRGGLNVFEDGKLVQIPALAPVEKLTIYALLRDRDGGMWISSGTMGLFRFHNGLLQSVPGPAGNETSTAYCLLEDSDGQVWGSVGNGTILCHKNGEWRRYAETNGLPFAYVTCMGQERDGTIWAGSLDAGLYYFHSGAFHALRKADGLSGDDIRSLYADREGNLWVGTRSAGLNRLNRPTLITCSLPQGLTNEYTRAVAETSDGVIWVGTTGGGLYRGTPNRMEPFGPSEVIRHYATVETVWTHSDGSLWWGGARSLLNWRDGAVTCYTNEPWVRSAQVTALCEDGQRGLWVGTSFGTLVHGTGGKFTVFSPRIARGPITALAQQPDGLLWVGSLAGGLKGVRDGSKDVVSITNGMLSQSIRTLYLDRESTLYIGTAGGGLARLRGGKVASFTSEQGLGADTVSQIVEDDFGHLWLGCSRGILRVTKNDLENLAEGRTSFLHPRAYGLNDGMLAEECSSGFSPAGIKTSSGLVCFSTVKGLVFIDPRGEDKKQPPPNVLLEEVSLNGKRAELHQASSQRRSKVISPGQPEGPLLVVPAGPRAIEINYTAINFAAPEKVRFRYQLEGLDPDWQEAQGRRTAYYDRVPAGNYVFKVMASNADADWSTTPRILLVTVEPQIWESRWFPFAAVLVGVGLIAGILRMAERRRYRRRLVLLETQNAVARERLRISQDMHDHIGAILTQVSLLSDLGQSQSEVPGAASRQFEKIGHQTRTAVQALDEIIWATNPQNDNLPRFAEYVSRYADELFESSTARCWQEIPADLPNLPLRADLRHNVFLAIREGFNNVLKHSGASEVWLRLSSREGEVVAEIQDNGQGFSLEKVAAGGNGLTNMQSRLAESGGRMELHAEPGRGVRIRFFFPLSGTSH